MSAVTRARDLADVMELIRNFKLPEDFGEQLPPSVRSKFAELWQAIQDEPQREA